MTLCIQQVDLHEIHLPLVEPFRISSGETLLRRMLLLRVRDRDGHETWSECVAGESPNYSPEAVDLSWTVLEKFLLPRVLGVEFENPQALDEALANDIRGHLMSRAAVEMAAWGLTAVKQGVSLSELVGGTRDKIATGISVGIQSSPEALVAKARAAVAEGYQKVKIKIKPGLDLQYLAAVREALPEAHLMADANNAYTLDDLDHLIQLDQFGLMMIEQPLAWDDVYRHAQLQKHLKTPVCLDESITDLERARQMVELDSGRIVNIKPGRVGGFTRSIAIHDFCEANGVPVWCGGMLETGIGRAYNVALASKANFLLPGDVSPSRRYWKQDVVTPEWDMDGAGWVTVPKTPGLGVQVDVERIKELTRRSSTVSAG